MLSTNEITPADNVVAAVPECLCELSVLAACRSQLTSVPARVRENWCAARRIESLYHPGRHLCVVYALLAESTLTPERYWPEADLVYFHTPVREPVSRRGQILQLGAHPVEAYRFPNDRRLRGIRHVASRDGTMGLLDDWLGSRNAAPFDRDTLQRKLIRYVPEQKWVIRVRAARGSERPQRMAVRAGSTARVRMLVARHRALAAASADPQHAFSFPALIGSSPDRGVFGVEWIRGMSLLETLEEVDAQSVLTGVARRLHRLHQTRVPGLPHVGRSALVQRVRAAVRDLAYARPDLMSSLQEVQRRFQAAVCAGDPSSGTIHNDFHWNQLSIKRDRVGLFDLERLAEGDPLWDVASFASQLQMLGHRSDVEVDPLRSERWRHEFLEAWRQLDSRSVDTPRFAGYCAAARLELARGMMRHLRPGWTDLARASVAFALTDFPIHGRTG